MTSRQSIEATRDFGRSIDFGRTASDYSTFRAGFPSAFFDALIAYGYAKAGQKALDIGTGTGTVARGLAEKGLEVFGIDPAQPLLDEARALDQKAGVSVAYRKGSAEDLTEDDNAFDLVTAGQCWHWFDRPKAAAQAARVLKPGGRLIIAHFDWLPLAGNVVEATEALILTHNPSWTMGGGTGIYPQWLRDLAEGGFSNIETFSFDISVPYSHEGWRGRIRASAGVQASLAAPEIEAFDNEHAAMLTQHFPTDPLAVPHRVWAATGIIDK